MAERERRLGEGGREVDSDSDSASCQVLCVSVRTLLDH